MRRAFPPLLLSFALSLASAGPAAAAFPGRDGRIAFTQPASTRDPDATFAIQSVRPDGRARVTVTDGSEAAYSPTGRQLAYVRNGTVYVAKADGTKPRAVASGTNPAWSPDSEQIVLEQGSSGGGDTSTGYPNLAIVDVRTGQARELATYAGSPSWSPAGNYIAFVDFRTEAFDSIARIRPDGTGRRVVYRPPDGWAALAPDWSPTGRAIAFVRTIGDVSSLVAARPDGTRVRVLSRRRSGTASFISLAWAPSGTRIAFSAYDGHHRSVYSLPARGGSPRLVAGGGFDPTWRPVH
jgi:hypothetical protein